MKKIRVGSRDSKLAVIQSHIIIDMIKEKHGDIDIELVTMKTTGDKILDRTLDKVGGKGLFVKELDRALLENEVDITVHSLKDVPMETDERIPLLGFTKCEDARDALVLKEGLKELDMSLPIGCSSMRRRLQLQMLYPGINVVPVRGNLQTRFRKLDEGEYGALVLAAAGLKRLGMEKRIHKIFSTEEMIPAAGQGVIAVQGRKGEDYSYLDGIFDDKSRIKAEAERAFVKTLNGGCSSPIAAHAQIDNDEIILRALYVPEDKISTEAVIICKERANLNEARIIGEKLAYQMKEKAGE